MRVALSVTLLVASSTLARVATADVAPPPGFVNRCTLENAMADGDECVMLDHWAFDHRCVKALADQGFCRRCGSGATQRSEIFCRKPQPNALATDWKKQCLRGPDPRLDRDDDDDDSPVPRPVPRPPPPKVDYCPTERTTSGVSDSHEEPSPSPSASRSTEVEGMGRLRSGCACEVGTPGAAPVSTVAALFLVALLRRRRAPRALHR